MKKDRTCFLLAFSLLVALGITYLLKGVISLGVFANNGIPDIAFTWSLYVEKGIERTLRCVSLITFGIFSILLLARAFISKQVNQTKQR